MIHLKRPATFYALLNLKREMKHSGKFFIEIKKNLVKGNIQIKKITTPIT